MKLLPCKPPVTSDRPWYDYQFDIYGTEEYSLFYMINSLYLDDEISYTDSFFTSAIDYPGKYPLLVRPLPGLFNHLSITANGIIFRTSRIDTKYTQDRRIVLTNCYLPLHFKVEQNKFIPYVHLPFYRSRQYVSVNLLQLLNKVFLNDDRYDQILTRV